MRFWVSLFDDVFAKSCQGEDMSLDEFTELIRNTSAPKKAELPIAKFARFGTIRSGAGSLRHDTNILSVSGAEGDYDGGEMPLDEAIARLEAAGFAFVIHTTPSHHPQRPRWRVWVPFSRELPPGRRAKMIDRVNGVLGAVLSRESWVPSQGFYIGAVAGVPFAIATSDGEECCIDECTELDPLAMPYQAPKTKPRKGAPPDFAKLDEPDLIELIHTGQHYYRAATELAWRWVQQGVRPDQAEDNLRAAFDAVMPTLQQEKKWQKGRKAIPKWVARTYARVSATA